MADGHYASRARRTGDDLCRRTGQVDAISEPYPAKVDDAPAAIAAAAMADDNAMDIDAAMKDAAMHDAAMSRK